MTNGTMMWLAVGLACVSMAGCLPSGDDGDGSVRIGGGPALPGAETTNDGVEVAPSTQSMGDESLETNASSSTSETCASGVEECSYWHCRCEDGALVNTRFCNNGVCMGPGAICEDACGYFDHGAWTGLAGGGPPEPVSPQEDSSESDGPIESSNSDDGSGDVCTDQRLSRVQSCDTCSKQECCGEALWCYGDNDCLNYWDCVVFEGRERFECDMLHPNGSFPYEELRECLVSSCAVECG